MDEIRARLFHDEVTMNRPVKKLFDLEIDEVSVVDRAANQHSLISFSKSAGIGEGQSDPLEDQMPEIYDAEGYEVDGDLLEHGDVVFDGDGNEYVFVEDYDEGYVGKVDPGRIIANRAASASRAAARRAAQEADAAARSRPIRVKNPPRRGAGPRERIAAQRENEARHTFQPRGSQIGTRFGDSAEEAANVFMQHGQTPVSWTDRLRQRATQATYDYPALLGTQTRRRVTGGVAGGAGLAGVGGAGYLALRDKEKVAASLGDQVLYELSKSLSDEDRNDVIAKAMDEVEIAKAAAAEAWEYAALQEDARLEQEFISKAEEYNLPVAPEDLGPILKSLALGDPLTDEELDILDAILSSVGDALYDEVGYVGGGSNSSIMDQVDYLGSELVGKSDFTHPQAVTAMFDANPAAYDAYLSEMGR